MTLNPALRRAVLIAAKTAGIRALFVTGTEAGPAADPHPRCREPAPSRPPGGPGPDHRHRLCRPRTGTDL